MGVRSAFIFMLIFLFHVAAVLQSEQPKAVSYFEAYSNFREATVSGSVIVDGTNILTNLNEYGYLYSSTIGTLEIRR